MNSHDGNFLVRISKAALLLFILVGMAGCGKNYSREEFKHLSMHKTEIQVRSVLGDPSWVSDSKPKTWIYYRKTYDAAHENKDDYRASLKFAPDPATGQDKVVGVEFAATAGSI